VTLARWKVGAAPLALRGFDDINRFWDGNDGRWVAQVLPGNYYVTKHDEVISTILGSCISTCVRDPEIAIGGMNHFMLPKDPGNDSGGDALRYGCFAIERLINVLVKHGAERDRLEVKVFGGGRVIAGMGDVGRSNIVFVRDYFATEGLEVVAEDVGGNYARRIRYYPATGRTLVKVLETHEAADIAQSETRHQARLSLKPPGGEVELFG
jgi:chemotaxis protein CheD